MVEVVFGSFRGEEGDSNSVMDLSHINQDKILPEVDLVSNEDDKSKTYFIHLGSGGVSVGGGGTPAAPERFP